MKNMARVGSVVGAALWVAGASVASAELVAEENASDEVTLQTSFADDAPQGASTSETVTLQRTQPGAMGIQEGTRVQDRQAMREVLRTSEGMRVAMNDSEASAEVSVPLSQSELIRNKRTRLEIQNEDILQRRLEEIRLRDEQRRMDQLLAQEGYVKKDQAQISTGSSGETLEVGLSNPQLKEAPAPVASPVVMQTQVISPALQSSVGVTSTPVASANLSSPESSNSSMAETVASETMESVRWTLVPRFGVSSFQDQVAPQVISRFAAGLGLGMEVTDHLAFEVGYTYSEFGVAGWSTNPYVANLQLYTNVAQPITLSQNVADAGLKLYAMGSSSRIRPYLFAGAAYSKSFVNYDQQIVQYLTQQGLSGIARDLESNTFLGTVGAGLDIKLTSNVFVGLSGRYYSVLNSSVSSQAMGIGAGLANPAYGYYYNNYAAASYLDYDKQMLGGGFARSDFYTIAGSIGFTF